MINRPYILTISGFDPSNGAGLSADVKTIENLKGYALSVCSANTVQNDQEFESCKWTSPEVMKRQIEFLQKRFEFDYVKVGIVESWEIAMDLIELLRSKNKTTRVILDPVLRSSSNFDFHPSSDQWDKFLELSQKLFFVTPNYDEIEAIFPDRSIGDTLEELSTSCHVYLKGGHRRDYPGRDEIYTDNGKVYPLNPRAKEVFQKHGSGCVLSSALTTYLAQGYPELKAALRAKRYTEQFLNSNPTFLGYHKR